MAACPSGRAVRWYFSAPDVPAQGRGNPLASSISPWKARWIAISVFGEFDGLPDEENVTIPSSDGEEQEDKARLYGSEYYSLEDATVGSVVDETDGRGKPENRTGLLRGWGRGACDETEGPSAMPSPATILLG